MRQVAHLGDELIMLFGRQLDYPASHGLPECANLCQCFGIGMRRGGQNTSRVAEKVPPCGVDAALFRPGEWVCADEPNADMWGFRKQPVHFPAEGTFNTAHVGENRTLLHCRQNCFGLFGYFADICGKNHQIGFGHGCHEVKSGLIHSAFGKRAVHGDLAVPHAQHEPGQAGRTKRLAQ